MLIKLPFMTPLGELMDHLVITYYLGNYQILVECYMERSNIWQLELGYMVPAARNGPGLNLLLKTKGSNYPANLIVGKSGFMPFPVALM